MKIKLNKRQRNLLWGEGEPYSEAEILIQSEVLGSSLGKTYLDVEVRINPTTYEIVETHRGLFAHDEMVQIFLDDADFQGQEYGYVVSVFSSEMADRTDMNEATKALSEAQKALIRMHKFVSGVVHIDGVESQD